MNDAIADLFVDWTARLSVGCYLAWALTAVVRKEDSAGARVALGLYAAGWLWMLVHFFAVFELVHGWSHAAAFEHTARRTAEVTGLDFGGGLYFNYALIVIWGVDVVWRVLAGNTPARLPVAWTVTVHVFLVFMIFNATVVFGPPGWIAVACGFTGLLCGIVAANRRRNPAGVDRLTQE